MPQGVELLQTVCPCGCRGPVLFRAERAARGVTCPASGRRYALPAGKPVKLKFARKQWETCPDARLLRQALAQLGAKPSSRKKRLAALRVAEVCLDWCRSPAFALAKRVARELAEGGSTATDCATLGRELAPDLLSWERLEGWRLVGLRLLQADPDLDYGSVEVADPRRVAASIKEVLPNPFRAVELRPEWLTPTVTLLAGVIRRHERFDDLPILADMLEDAGCQDWPTLAHLRGEAEHGPGCWALDLVPGPTMRA